MNPPKPTLSEALNDLGLAISELAQACVNDVTRLLRTMAKLIKG